MKNVMIRRSIAAVGATLLVAAVPACSQVTSGQPASTVKTSTVKIGAAFPLTGNLAFSGKRGLDGVNIAVEMINEDGGINGKKVEVVSVDAADTASAQSGATRLVTQDKVSVVVGSTSSSIASVSAPTVDRLGGFFWETSAIAPAVTGSGYKHVFRTITQSTGQGSFAADYIINNLAKQLNKEPSAINVGILYTDDAYGAPIAKAEIETLKKANVNVSVIVPYQASSMRDFSPAILKLKQAKVDVTLHAAQLPDAILFWRQAKQAGLSLAAAGGTGSAYSEAGFPDALGKEINGVFNVVPPTPDSINIKMLSAAAQKVLARFQTKVKAKNLEPSSNMEWAFMGAWVLLHDVMPKAKDLTPDSLRTAALSIDIAAKDTITGYGVKFDETGQNTKAFPVAQQWQDGALKTIFPKDLSVAATLTNRLPNS